LTNILTTKIKTLIPKKLKQEQKPLKQLVKEEEKFKFEFEDARAEVQDNEHYDDGEDPLNIYGRALTNYEAKKFEELYDIEESIHREDVPHSDVAVNTIWTGKPIVPIEFDMNSIRPDYTIALFGKRREGKSFCMRWILYHMRGVFPCGIVFSHTDRFIHVEFNANVLDQFMEVQKQRVFRHKAGLEPNPYAFVIFDDVLGPDLYYDATLRRFFNEGRHYKMFVIISTQYVKGLPPSMRTNTDLAIVYRQGTENTKKA